MNQQKKKLGEMLIEAGLIDREALGLALSIQKKTGRRLGTILMQEGLIEENVLLGFLKRQLGVDVIAGEEIAIDDQVWDIVPTDLIRKYNIIPLKLENNMLVIASSDPFNLASLDDIRFAASVKKVKVVLAAEKTIENIILDRVHKQGLIYDIIDHGELYKKALQMIDAKMVDDIPIEESEEEHLPLHELEIETTSPPIISLVNYIFYEAVISNASDIHIEPYNSYFRIRFRIDGILHTVLTPPHRLHVYIVSRIKIMSQMDISKRYVPQDGHLVLKIRSEIVHFRVSTLPTVYGEKCVLRVLRRQKHLEDLDALGFSPEVLEKYKKIIKYPQGMILFSGPTGSGKTTTLYASLNYINHPEINIVTLEDPVESTLYGINHVQIRHEHGLRFADGLRSILRQDPDIIFVGEIRDADVAEIAMRASMTGHLVFSTLHANSTVESFERLLDMGVAPYLVSSTLLAIVSQRLLRKVCPSCKMEYRPTPEDIDEFNLSEQYLSEGIFFKNRGCTKCRKTGYIGRIAAFEVLFISQKIRKLAKQGADKKEIEAQAYSEGMPSILDDGLAKVAKGITTFDELRRVLMARY